jgi:hypothetical protein
MQDTKEKELMLKFLNRNYPVHRIKNKTRFKRTIILENGESYILSDKKNTQELYNKLIEILKTIFSTTEEINKDVLKNFLNLK